MKIFTSISIFLSASLFVQAQFTDVVNNNISCEFREYAQLFSGPNDGGSNTNNECVLRTKIAIAGSTSPENCVTWVSPFGNTTPNYDDTYIWALTNVPFNTKFAILSRMWESDGNSSNYCTYNSNQDDHYYADSALLNGNKSFQKIVYPHAYFRPSKWIGELANGLGVDVHNASSNWDQVVKLMWRYNHGDSFNDPLRFEVIGDNQTKTDINSITDIVGGISNNVHLDYNNSSGTGSIDVYYSFEITKYSEVTISTIDAVTNFDTKMFLMDQTQAQIGYNDDANGTYQSEIVMDLCPGTYTIRIENYETSTTSDALFKLSVEVQENPLLSVSSVTTDATCADTQNGSIVANNPNGGLAPYTYKWFNGSSLIGQSATVNNLAVGNNYKLEMKDACNQVKTINNIQINNGDATDPIANCVSGPFNLVIYQGLVVDLNPVNLDSGSTDNCGIAEMTSNATFDYSSPSPNLAILTVKDDNGNSSTCSVDVNIEKTPNGLNDIENKNAFLVYPNPSDGMLNVRLNSRPANCVLKLYDKLGRTVFENTLYQNETSLNFGDLPQGIYSAELIIDGQFHHQQIVIN